MLVNWENLPQNVQKWISNAIGDTGFAVFQQKMIISSDRRRIAEHGSKLCLSSRR